MAHYGGKFYIRERDEWKRYTSLPPSGISHPSEASIKFFVRKDSGGKLYPAWGSDKQWKRKPSDDIGNLKL
jgi:hypothetical protein